MSNCYLLTGAGFSKGFGGLLCNELTAYFFNSLVLDEEIQKNILHHGVNNNFEQILSIIRTKYPAKAKKFEEVLKTLFQRMFNGLDVQTSTGNQKDMVEEFFWNFDCVFTLNQDSFYKKANRKPDKQFTSRRHPETHISLANQNSNDRPYIELHGAYDWEDVFILGNNKEDGIKQKPRLEKYFEFFKECLNKANSKLVIIGYSFCDDHINKILNDGINKGLRIFIWDPNVNNYLLGKKITEMVFVPTPANQIQGVSKENLAKSLQGYLPTKFNLASTYDVAEVINFLGKSPPQFPPIKLPHLIGKTF